MTYNNYRLIESMELEAVKGKGLLLEHEKSGARIFAVSNDDNNKVFNIGFRTPPADNTGLPHILEHSVLCGSRKYPVKDPFIELAKGSLNTFLNAMTYSDKTVYPVASCNTKDFRNLVDVYLDAVLYPNIYNEPRTLLQEGWHYEMDDINGDITINGVVYNEMKGAYSSPEQVLFSSMQKAMFPNHPYGCDSGGDPEAIPELTQAQFEAFHKTYYHPSNSYIYIYGDMDIEEQLSWLDEQYLSAFDRIEVKSKIETMEPFEAPKDSESRYAISSDASDDKKTYLSYSVAIKKPEDPSTTVALEILEYLLMDAPGAVLKDALLALDIAEEVFGFYDSGLNQPMFGFVAKNANRSDEGVFIDTIESVLASVVDNGFERKKLEAAINRFEFKFKEADFGQYPKGLIYGLKALETWLYDGDPKEAFMLNEVFEKLRAGIEDGLFEQIVKTLILDNTHKSKHRLIPDKNLLKEKSDDLNKAMKAYKATLSEEEKKNLIDETEALKQYQSEPSSKEVLEKIPLLELEDIDKAVDAVTYETIEKEGITYIVHKTFTNDIVYMKLLFDFSMLSMEEIPYLGLFTKLFTKLGTENFTVSQLTDEINIASGGMSAAVNVYTVQDDPDQCMPRLEINFKCFTDNIKKTIDLVEEVVFRTLYEDQKRIFDLVNEIKSRLSRSLMNSGHSAGMTRASSYHTISGRIKDTIEGIGYYRFIKDIDENNLSQHVDQLKKIKDKVFSKANSVILINTEQQHVAPSMEGIQSIINQLPQGVDEECTDNIVFEALNEGFKTPAKVQYCSMSGNFVEEGYHYTGHMKVLQTIMSLDYMWKEVRVKGGAYGGFAGFAKSGLFYISSYRDPNLDLTYKIFEALPNYIRALDLDDRELKKYVIGTISNLDVPLTPSMKGSKAISAYMSGITREDLQKERDEVLSTRTDDLKAIGDIVEKAIVQGQRCVIGNEEKIEAEQTYLNTVESLF